MKIYQLILSFINFVSKIQSLYEEDDLKSNYHPYIVEIKTGNEQCAGVLIESNMVLTTHNCYYQNNHPKSIFIYREFKDENGDSQSYYESREAIRAINLTKLDAALYHTPILLKFEDEIEYNPVFYSDNLGTNVSVEYFATFNYKREHIIYKIRSYELPLVNNTFCNQNSQFGYIDKYQGCTLTVYREAYLSNIHLGSPVFKTDTYALVGLLTSVHDKIINDTYFSTFVDLTHYYNEIEQAIDELLL